MNKTHSAKSLPSARSLRCLSAAERLIEYDSKLNEFFPRYLPGHAPLRSSTLSFPYSLNVLITHSFVVMATRIDQNSYFLPAGLLCGRRIEPGIALWASERGRVKCGG